MGVDIASAPVGGTTTRAMRRALAAATRDATRRGADATRARRASASRARDGEGFWRRSDDDGGFHDAMPRAPTWSTTALAGDEREREDDDARDDELGRAAALAATGMGEGRAREAFARDVAGALRFARALERVRADGVERMWTTAHGDGLRMRFDGVARVDGEAGEREAAAAPRERLLREAKYARGEYYVAPRSRAVE